LGKTRFWSVLATRAYAISLAVLTFSKLASNLKDQKTVLRMVFEKGVHSQKWGSTVLYIFIEKEGLREAMKREPGLKGMCCDLLPLATATGLVPFNEEQIMIILKQARWMRRSLNVSQLRNCRKHVLS
jgi:hypothetical protein